MQQETPSGRFRRLIGLKRVLAANLVIFAVIGWGFSGELMRNRDMQKEVDRLKAESEALEAKNVELADAGKHMSSTEMLERQARLKLNLRKPGEEVVVVKPGPGRPVEDEEPVPTRTQEKDGSRTNPARWWHYFFR